MRRGASADPRTELLGECGVNLLKNVRVRVHTAQVVNHAKERAALKTILESKICTLVSGISHSLKEDPSMASNNPRLAREVQALEKLVNATVNAMRSSASSGAAGGA
eukprot:852997-Pyramimonas_sp.AAC.2